VLQRKSLMQAKESTSREMEKLLKQIDSLRSDLKSQQADAELKLTQARDEANVTIKGLREANERLFEDSERLQTKYNDLAEAKETELTSLA